MIPYAYQEALELLKNLIATPSLSREEDQTAQLIEQFLAQKNIPTFRKNNNVWAKNRFFDAKKPTILLNSHHDTVKPNAGYSLNPFEPIVKDGKLYGLGSNDAGASLVGLLAVFVHFFDQKLPYNLLIAATAEEEISGKNGIESILEDLGKIELAIVGEPTEMQMAVAEKGLLVVDCTVEGIAGHAARKTGENAIYKALPLMEWVKNFQFEKISDFLGETTMNLTVLQAGTQHNVIPDRCTFTLDIRLTDAYTHAEILEILRKNLPCQVIERSQRLRPSYISLSHPIVQKAQKMGKKCFGSPTLSDQALMPFTSVKIGIGKSERSHSADEFVFLDELENGIADYISLLNGLEI